MTIHFPSTVDAIGAGEIRAGATDVGDRRKRGISTGPVEDLRDLVGLDQIDAATEITVGAGVTLEAFATHPELRTRHPGLAQAAGGLATPQIRAVATVGGALLQRTRCSYFRDPTVRCFKRGGGGCPAASGDRIHLAALVTSPCLCVHPSTLGAALVAFDATTTVLRGPSGRVAALYGDGADPTRDHQLPAGAVLTAVHVPPPAPGERSTWLRIAGRTRAEWPLVEVIVRRAPGLCRVVVGGVANVPLDLVPVAAALDAGRAWEPVWRRLAASHTISEPARYKLGLVEAALTTALERLG